MQIDDVLGNYETRYFGIGHKNTEYQLSGILETTSKETYCIANVRQKNVWSNKAGKMKKQHLSTIDGVILSVGFIEKILLSKNKVVENLILNSLKIQSSREAIEDMANISIKLDNRHSDLEKNIFSVNILDQM